MKIYLNINFLTYTSYMCVYFVLYFTHVSIHISHMQINIFFYEKCYICVENFTHVNILLLTYTHVHKNIFYTYACDDVLKNILICVRIFRKIFTHVHVAHTHVYV